MIRRRRRRNRSEVDEPARSCAPDPGETQLEIVRRLSAAVESREAGGDTQAERLGALAYRLARAAGLAHADADMLRQAIPLHDIGKIAIPDRILLKPGKLDEHEWKLMKTHAAVGARMLRGSRSPLVQMAEMVALSHHERWDGSGYPRGLRGEEIPLGGRICAICDAYDALVSKRPYKEPLAAPDAFAEIERSSGTHFDPRLVEAFLGMRADIEHGVPTEEWALAPEDIINAPSR